MGNIINICFGNILILRRRCVVCGGTTHYWPSSAVTFLVLLLSQARADLAL